MEIRQETPQDYDAVYEVVKRAFLSAQHSDGTEQDLVVALRKSESFVPELSLVATQNGRVVGHILFTRVCVGAQAALALAPLSVLPSCQRQGIGTALMEEGHRIAAALGYGYSIVLGHPGYYPRAGYVPASTYGIQAPFDVADESFMALKLSSGAGQIAGRVRYDAAFGID